MKMPMPPPNHLFKQLPQTADDMKRLIEIMTSRFGPAPDDKYRHWDVLRHLQPPDRFSSEEWWIGIKTARQQLYRELPLTDGHGRPFRYALVDLVFPMIHYIDKHAAGEIHGDDILSKIITPQTRDTYLVKSLTEEAITSSQLEGAATTRAAAKEMIRSGRPPRNKNETMVVNNYQAMLFIRQLKGEPLTSSIILELQRVLTENTLDDPDASGRLRRSDEPIVVQDQEGRLLHRPPDASELEARMDSLCQFANDQNTMPFVHPVVRAILLHFWLAYDHPFVDGNGRTARALFYWSMANQGYWLCEFISISRILKAGPSQYYRAFLYTESDDNDATYFILNQLRVILRAIEDLHTYLKSKAAEMKATKDKIGETLRSEFDFNPRQLTLMNHALKHPGFPYSFASHERSHNVSYQTARTDLLKLHDEGLLEMKKRGRKFVFYAPRDLEKRLAKRKEL